MRKNLYEIFDEFAGVKSKQEKINVLSKYWSPTLKLALQLAYHPSVEWKFKAMPKEYKTPDTVPGISYSSLEQELKRLYLFEKNNPAAEKLTEKKSKELLVTLLESLEPREAELVIGIFKKDLGVKGLTYKFIHDNIPGVLPD
jgi:hypothetical protein